MTRMICRRSFPMRGRSLRVLRNLISNALKFTEKGEVRISSRLAGNDQILFEVRDTGIGIAPENLERIFQDFAQVDNPIQRRVKGTGLGLPLSKKLATLLGGEITVQSLLGAGSVFTLRLPLHYQEIARTQIVALDEWVLDPTSVPILIVEDSPEMMLMYKSYLKGSGFQVFPAGTTREADDILERIRPGVVLLDIRLRFEDTWKFLTQFKEDSRTKDIPVLMVSTIEDQAKSYHLGVDSYLLKPIERTKLIRELQVLTGQRPFSEILIIDDDERDRYLVRQQLRKMSVLTSEATSGIEGIRKACESKPGVILLDLAMPGISGFETLDRLKAEPVTKHIPVIIVTSQILTEEERGRLMDKAFAIVGKGSERAELEDVLRRTLQISGVDANATRGTIL